MEKTFKLGTRHAYPITIRKILKNPGDQVRSQEPVLEFSFNWKRLQGDDRTKEEYWVTHTNTVPWESPSDGVLKNIYVHEGQELQRDGPCVRIEETCSHEIQYQGLCAVCGKDMTQVNWASEERDTARAPINMTHDNTALTISEAAAQRHTAEQQTRLLKQRKLSLVVDLDQTIIHACIEPTVGEWQRDPSNPNYEAVKDVKSFQLSDEGPRGLATGCWYYIKLRPGLAEFLETVSEMYELHVYTMGTRAYAQNIAKLVDPHQKLFGNRVISRDENGSLTAKSLERLFPSSTGMVAIIDDRADVWPKNRDNLLKVTPYDFFKGIGDINSSFLPKRQDIAPAPPVIPAQNGNNDNPPETKLSALEELVKMSSGDDTVLRQKQAEEQERELEKQLKELPLLHMQEQLEKEDGINNSTQSTEGTDSQTNGDDSPSSQSSQPRHNLLRDDDRELEYLKEHLTNLHNAFYSSYDIRRAERQGVEKPDDSVDLSMVPDVGRVLANMKRQVLTGVTVVLSGLIPTTVDVQSSEIGLQVKSFGARLDYRVSKRLTHLVVSSQRTRTAKVREAARLGHVKIVNQNWLTDCMAQWTWVDETPYLIDIHPEDRKPRIKRPPPVAITDIADAPDTDTERPKKKARLIIRTTDATGHQTLVDDGEGGGANFDLTDEEDDDESGAEGTDLGDLVDFEPDDVQDGMMSPIDGMKSFDWGSADAELEDFLGSDADDDDDGDDESESEGAEGADAANGAAVSGVNGNAGGGKRKRLREDDDGDGESESEREGGSSSMGLSALAKRQKFSRERTSRLRGQLLTPNDGEDEGSKEEDMEVEDEADLDLEAELMAELEAAEEGNGV